MIYYTLTTYDRTLNVAPATLDISTPLYLPGKDYSGYGQAYDQNFLNLLQNFAGSNSPTNPITGTIWFNPSNNNLNVWNSNAASWIGINQVTNSTLIFVGDVTGSGTVGNTVNLSLTQTSVVPGTYTSANLTIGADGRILSASNGSVANSTTPVTSFNTRIGAITLNYTDVVNALGYIPINNTNTYYAVNASVVHKVGDTMTGDLNMNGTQTVTGLRAPSSPTDAVRYQEYSIALLSSTLLQDSGSPNTVIVTPSPAIGSYITGLACKVKMANTNTGASTLNINSLGPKNILWNGAFLFPNALASGGIYEFCYDGASFQLLTTPNASGMITNNYLAQMPGKTIKGNNSGVSSTPQDISFSSLFSGSLSSPGYTIFPNGLILQWGAYSYTTSTHVYIKWPITFPNALLVFNPGMRQTYNSNNQNNVTLEGEIANTVSYYAWSSSNGDNDPILLNWIAIGY